MSKKYLLLGGAGLLGSAIATEIIKRNEQAVIVDIPEKILHKASRIGGAIYRGEDVFKKKALSECIQEVRPDIIINAINLATIFSDNPEEGYTSLIKFYVSLYAALVELSAPVHYIQMGTTGAGGLGFNIPFTHGDKLEDLPIIHKAAFSGITTSLLTMLSRSFKSEIKISEVKPGLAIFADAVQVEQIEGGGVAATTDGGESGPYTYNELALLTASMGFTTADCIARDVIAVIEEKRSLRRLSTYDVTEILNATIIAPTKSDEKRRQHLMKMLQKQGGAAAVIATGSLGPPSITRDLIISHAIIAKIPVSVDMHFFASLQLEPAIKATCTYIKKTHPELFAYLEKECTYGRYQVLSGKFKKQREAWELLVV